MILAACALAWAFSYMDLAGGSEGMTMRSSPTFAERKVCEDQARTFAKVPVLSGRTVYVLAAHEGSWLACYQTLRTSIEPPK